jgi:DNA-binding Lrp family transcriptional regulator
MVFGYFLISTKNSYEHEISDKLHKIDEVVDVEPLIVKETALADPFFKNYDLIAKIKADNTKDFKKILDNKIRAIHGVEKTRFTSKPKL